MGFPDSALFCSGKEQSLIRHAEEGLVLLFISVQLASAGFSFHLDSGADIFD